MTTGVKHRVEMVVNRLFWNRFTLWLGRHGFETRFWRELETIGARTGQVRRVPVAVLVDSDGSGAWLISQHGRRSGWAHNIVANPRVRVRARGQWLEGSATLRPDIEVREVARRFAPHPAFATITELGFRALATDPIPVRVEFDA